MIASYLARLTVTTAGTTLRAPAAVLERTRLHLRLWPTDLDVLGHVNNGRYLTLMDMGRVDYGIRLGLARLMLQRRWLAVVGGATVRFRRELKAFERVELTTQLVHWDDKWMAIEHRFEKDGHLCAWGAVRVVMKSRAGTVRPAEVLQSLGVTDPSPELTEDEISSWLRSLERPLPSMETLSEPLTASA